MLPRWLMAMFVLFQEAWSARGDNVDSLPAKVERSKVQAELSISGRGRT